MVSPCASWPDAAVRFAPPCGVVHVWSVRLDGASDDAVRLSCTLDDDERDRAARFVFARDQRRFACARGGLRTLLGAYLQVDPRALVFAYGAHGKPVLGGVLTGALAFNVSHSDELAVIAVAAGGELGVDVEAIRSMADRHEIARRFFTPAEAATLRTVRDAEQDVAFFRCWTRKEAYLKALGDGLARPLDSFDVTFTTDAAPSLRVAGDEAETARWAVTPLQPAAGYVAALVAARGLRVIECGEWTESRAADLQVRAAGEMREPV